MAGAKVIHEVELSRDQLAFLTSAKDRFGIRDESKVIRIMVDYLLTTPDVHQAVFKKTRCLRCE